MKALELLLIGFLFLGLLSWYMKTVENRSHRVDNIVSVKIPFKILIDKEERKCFLSSSVKKLKGKKSPVIIFLHGMDGAWPNRNFTRLQYDYLNKLAWEKEFIGVFPRGTKGACENVNERSMFYYCWSLKDNKDRNFIKKLREAVISQYKTDPKKVFLIGFSNGGYFVSDYLFNSLDNEFAGYGIHSAGGLLSEKSPVNSAKIKLPVSLNVGIKDTYQLDEMRNFKTVLLKLGWVLGKNLNYQEFLGTHEIKKENFQDEINFFLSNK